MKTSATILFTLSSKKQLQSILNALYPETQTPKGREIKVDMESTTNSLALKFIAPNTVALRSTLNAYLRWTNSIMELTSNLGDS